LGNIHDPVAQNVTIPLFRRKEIMSDKSLKEQLTQVQANLVAPKDLYNNFGKYKYRSCEGILNAVKPLLEAANMNLVIYDEIVLIGDRYYVKATAELSLGGENVLATAYAREPEDRKGMDASQITGATSTYARKYALNGLFLIDDVQDADHKAPNGDTPTPATKPTVTPPVARSEAKSDAISEKQGKRLIAIAKGSGYTVDDIKGYILLFHNIEHLRDIPWKKYDEIVKHFEVKETTPEDRDGWPDE
jgi:hypothetical protein